MPSILQKTAEIKRKIYNNLIPMKNNEKTITTNFNVEQQQTSIKELNIETTTINNVLLKQQKNEQQIMEKLQIEQQQKETTKNEQQQQKIQEQQQINKQQKETTKNGQQKRQIEMDETTANNNEFNEITDLPNNFKPYKFDENYVIPKPRLPLVREKSNI